MNLKCMLGLHKWEGFNACKECAKTRSLAESSDSLLLRNNLNLELARILKVVYEAKANLYVWSLAGDNRREFAELLRQQCGEPQWSKLIKGDPSDFVRLARSMDPRAHDALVHELLTTRSIQRVEMVATALGASGNDRIVSLLRQVLPLIRDVSVMAAIQRALQPAPPVAAPSMPRQSGLAAAADQSPMGTLFWHGFSGMVLAKSKLQDVEGQLGAGAQSEWLSWDGKHLGEQLAYSALGIIFLFRDSMLDTIQMGSGWQGKTSDGFALGSTTNDLALLVKTFGLTKYHLQGVCAKDNVMLLQGLAFRRVVKSPEGADLCVAMSFTFDAPIPSRYEPPWAEAVITGIRLSHTPDDLKKIAALSPCAPERLEVQEPWHKFRKYVSVPADVPDTERRSNMRFQFMFSSSGQADRIVASLPSNLRNALPAPVHQGLAPADAGPEVSGKFTVWYEGVSLTIGEGKALMNHVVQAGGGIYEAFLT